MGDNGILPESGRWRSLREPCADDCALGYCVADRGAKSVDADDADYERVRRLPLSNRLFACTDGRDASQHENSSVIRGRADCCLMRFSRPARPFGNEIGFAGPSNTRGRRRENRVAAGIDSVTVQSQRTSRIAMMSATIGAIGARFDPDGASERGHARSEKTRKRKKRADCSDHDCLQASLLLREYGPPGERSPATACVLQETRRRVRYSSVG